MSRSVPIVVPDYARPAALMVPHYRSTVRPFLEAIASAAAEHVGVILLANDPAETLAFVSRQPLPERYSIVAGSYNTPGFATVKHANHWGGFLRISVGGRTPPPAAPVYDIGRF